MTSCEAFLDQVGYSVDELEHMVSTSSIHDIWEVFGSYRTIRRSARPQEYGVLEISNGDYDYSLSFMLPFDADGKFLGAARIVLNTKEDEVDCRDLDEFISSYLFSEVAAEIQEDLFELSWETVLGRDFCSADHTYSLAREKALAENSV